MYISENIKNGLYGLWGWRQNYNTSDYTIAQSLTESSTSQYYQDVHPLLTLDNIKSIAPEFEAMTYSEWDTSTQYYKNDRVTLNDINYKALSDNIGADPTTSTTTWEVFDAFSEWLENKTKAGILKAVRSFWDEKMSEKTLKNILESKPLYDGSGRITDTIENQSQLVGFEITPLRAKGVTTKVEKIGLQFKGTGDITMYLYHSSRDAALQTYTFTRTRDSGMQWFEPTTELYLPYLSDDIDAGGSWYLCYKQDELPEGVEAIKSNKDWSKSPCSSCSRGDIANWKIWSKYLEVHPFKVTSDDSTLWDVANNLYTYESNYGINLQVTIECDITEIILEQKKAFQNIIGLQVAVDMIREFAYNPSFNIGRTQQNFSRMELLYELDGDSTSYKKSGLKYELDTAMKAVKLDATDMSRVCFPCNNRGVKHRAI